MGGAVVFNINTLLTCPFFLKTTKKNAWQALREMIGLFNFSCQKWLRIEQHTNIGDSGIIASFFFLLRNGYYSSRWLHGVTVCRIMLIFQSTWMVWLWKSTDVKLTTGIFSSDRFKINRSQILGSPNKISVWHWLYCCTTLFYLKYYIINIIYVLRTKNLTSFFHSVFINVWQ